MLVWVHGVQLLSFHSTNPIWILLPSQAAGCSRLIRANQGTHNEHKIDAFRPCLRPAERFLRRQHKPLFTCERRSIYRPPRRVLREINLIGRAFLMVLLQLRSHTTHTRKKHTLRYFRHLCDEFFVCPFRRPLCAIVVAFRLFYELYKRQ